MKDYNFKDFDAEFPDDDACLDFIFRARYSNHVCECGKSWFFAIFLFAKSKNGVAAKELERQLGVTYKTAHRMGHKIRELMNEDAPMFFGECEADETYIGGKRPGKRKLRQ